MNDSEYNPQSRELAEFNFLSKSGELSEAQALVRNKTKLLKFIQSIRVKDPTLADRIYTKIYPHAEQAQDTKLPIKKAVVQMAPHDGANLDTSSAAQELLASDPHWLDILTIGMSEYTYGDIPVEFMLAKGTLHLTKVDDGMFSGFFQYHKPTMNEETGELEEMADNAKVRIESMTLPAICVFMKVKNWLPEPPMTPVPEEVPSPEDYAALDRKIKILELLDRITGKIW